MDVQRLTSDDVYRVKYSRLPKERQCFVLDVRPFNHFKRRHLLLSYCVRVTADGRNLVDTSKNSYDVKWAQQIWWNADVVVLGEPGLKKDHDVIRFLAKEGRCHSLGFVKDGIDAVEREYPFLVGQSLKAHRALLFPSPVLDKQLFLGNWATAADPRTYEELRVRRVITIHNEPQNLKLQNKNVKRMAITAPDLPSTDLSQYFNATYEFIEEGLARGSRVLVHCGAGSSRSATICAAYLMRKNRWSARKATDYLVTRRASVALNEGFWRQLCKFEEPCNVLSSQRTDVRAASAVQEAYGEAGIYRGGLARDAAGDKVQVELVGADADNAAPEDAPQGLPSVSGAEKRGREAEEDRGDPGPAPKRGAREVCVDVEVDIVKGSDVIGSMKLPALKPHQRCVFGRSDTCDVVLQHASISRAHAELSVNLDGTVVLTDLGSAHGTNVNGVWVKKQQPKEVRVGTKFRFGASSRMYAVQRVQRS